MSIGMKFETRWKVACSSFKQQYNLLFKLMYNMRWCKECHLKH